MLHGADQTSLRLSPASRERSKLNDAHSPQNVRIHQSGFFSHPRLFPLRMDSPSQPVHAHPPQIIVFLPLLNSASSQASCNLLAPASLPLPQRYIQVISRPRGPAPTYLVLINRICCRNHFNFQKSSGPDFLSCSAPSCSCYDNYRLIFRTAQFPISS